MKTSNTYLKTKETAIEQPHTETVTVMGEIKSMRSANEKHFRLTDGSCAAVAYPYPAHYRTSSGTWEELKNKPELKDGSYAVHAGAVEKMFPEKLGKELFTLKYKEHLISLAMEGLCPSKAELTGNNEKKVAEPQTLAEASELRDFGFQLKYAEVLPGISCELFSYGYDVKQNLVLNAPQDKYIWEYSLKAEGLKPVLEKDGSISLRDPTGEIIAALPCPVMYDSADSFSDELCYELEEQKDHWLLRVNAEGEWIRSPERKYPIIIDPTLSMQCLLKTTGMTATHVKQGAPTSVAGSPQQLYFGYGAASNVKEMQIYMGFNSLPQIPPEGVIVNADLQYCQVSWSRVTVSSADIGIYQVTDPCPSTGYYQWIRGLKWNTRPATSDEVLDYTACTSATKNQYLHWDVTRSVKDWYRDDTMTRALALKLTGIERYSASYAVVATFVGYGGSNLAQLAPYLTVSYRYDTGLEDYWSRQSHSIDRAGTGHVGDWNGQLTLVKPDVSAAGTVCPAGISHVYNSAFSADQIAASAPGAAAYTAMKLGKGWKLDLQQTVTVYSSSYLQYLDGDGTVHFFYKTATNTYQDEDGLGLTITKSSTNFTMADRKGNTRYFAAGILSYMQDSNGNRITCNYDSSKRLTSLTRTTSGGTAETVATLNYAEDFLTSVTDLAGNTTSFTYTDGLLTGITHADGSAVSYSYDENGKLLSAADLESGYSMHYTWDEQNRISSYTEWAGEAQGAATAVSGANGIRTYRSSGKDRILNTDDDLITEYVFDYFGRTVSSSTRSADGSILYGASAAKYSANSGALKTNNRLQVGSSVGMRPVGNTAGYSFTNPNLLMNGEMSTADGWTGGSCVSDSRFGHALEVTGTSSANVEVSQYVALNEAASQTYILSGWAKAASVALKTGVRSFALEATVHYADNTTESHAVTYCADSTEWQYNVLPVVPQGSGTVTGITVKFTFNHNANHARFAFACLTKETAASYEYNSDGELVSVTSPGNETQQFTYSGADLIHQVTMGNGSYDYTYDAKHNVTGIRNAGVNMAITYDAKGNTAGTELAGENTDRITSSAVYDAEGNLLLSQTDARGSTTAYAYFSAISRQTGKPTAVTDAGNTTVQTTYDPQNGRNTSTAIAGTADLAYSYSQGRLAGIARTDAEEHTQNYGFQYDDFGKRTAVTVGSRTLAAYSYAPNNGLLQQMSYGNGATVEYAYDELERVTDVYYNGSVDPALHYSYTGEGAVGSLTDHRTGREYSYVYDSLGRLNGMTERENGTEVQSYTASYDTANRLVSAEYSVSPDGSGTMTGTRSTACSYEGSDGKLSAMTSPAGSFSYTYDGLKRLAEKELTGVSTEEFTYCAGQEAGTTTLLAESKRTKKADGSTVSEYTYTYDALGNITAISGSTNAAYTYDNQSQLLSETLEGITTCYTYDSVGNIRSVSEGGTTHTCTYGDAEWKDLLTAYDGHPITYDAIGNPLQWHDGRSFTWTDGRRLASATGNGNVISYTYNADGLRLTKNVNGTEHRYTWQGSRLISEYRAGNTLEFFYDESGRPAAFRHNGTAYYYVTNLQGDITHILDVNGNICAEYSYNAWGRILSATGTMAAVNPLRYRGYYYDAETGLYYVSSRYYDPEICRFINEDGLVSTGKGFIGTNMFAYCNNCPVVFNDFNGTMMTSCVDDSIVGGKKKDPVYEFINGQHLPEYCNIPYGNSTLGYSGCEVIALFNMLILRGAGESLDSIISFMVDRYNKYPNLLSGWGMYGKFGAAPQDIAAFLGARGIDYQFTYSLKNLNKKGELGVYIVSFWNSNGPVLPVFSGYHTVAISYDGTDYVSYNLDCDKNLTFSSPSGLPYFLDGTGGYFFGFFVPNS